MSYKFDLSGYVIVFVGGIFSVADNVLKLLSEELAIFGAVCVFHEHPHHDQPFRFDASQVSRKVGDLGLADYEDSLIEKILFLRKRYPDDKFVVIGHSMGGLICQRVARLEGFMDGAVLIFPAMPKGIRMLEHDRLFVHEECFAARDLGNNKARHFSSCCEAEF